MSDMKCPFCQQGLDYLAEDIYGNMYCPNCRDKNGFTYKASESIWQELIRTRKAVDLALERFDDIKRLYDKYYDKYSVIATETTEEIKQLIKGE